MLCEGRRLNLSNSSINDIIEIKGLEKFTNLNKLVLSGNNITEIKELEKLTNLNRLVLSGNKSTVLSLGRIKI